MLELALKIKNWKLILGLLMNTLLKPKRHSLRCHDFMVHALLLRICTNVVYFRVMRRLPSRMKLTMKLTMREPTSWDP